MAADITVTCGNVENGTGDIRAKIDAVHIEVTGADVWNVDGSQKRYRIRLDAPAGLENDTSSGYSELFAVSAEGDHEAFPGGYIFPGAGAWTINLRDEEDEDELTQNVATEAVTVV